MKSRTDLWTSVILGGAGGGVIVAAVGLRIGTATQPQPGFFPLLGGGLLVVLSTVLFVQAWRGRTASVVFGDLRRPAGLLGGLVLYVAVLNPLGYVIATTVLAAVVLWIMDTRSGWQIVGGSLALSVGTYFLFARLLSMPLPGGVLAQIM